MKKVYLIAIACVFSIGMTYLVNQFPLLKEMNLKENFGTEKPIIEQQVIQMHQEEKEIYNLYYQDRKIGVLNDKGKLDAFLSGMYKEHYEEEFPNTKLGLGEDVYISNSLSYAEYENKDDEILSYLEENDLFSVEAIKISFSNGAILYVKSLEDFETARDEYVLNFVSKEAYDTLQANQTTPELGNGNYGERVLSARFLDSFTIAKGLASKNKIAKNKNEVLTYLNYGYDTEEKSYVTQEFDTVAGIAWIKNITVQHLLSINNDKLRSADQLLPAGLTLNVKALNSPIQFEVVKEYQEERTVSPGEPEYIYDDTLQAGKRIVQQEAQLGLENVKLRERYINGVSVGGEEIASYRTKEPVREVIKVGTKILPNIGSGSFIWPVRNPIVTCGWGCYAGHQALDIQNRLDKYGRIYAADRGVIKVNSYHSINGYYYVIDHNNGYTTYYGHMAVPGFAAVGTTVAQGEEIGIIGETGLATGPHVHFEIRKNGVKLDPALFLP